MTLEESLKSINRAIGVGERKASSEVITRPLLYPHAAQWEINKENK